jgi:superfamily II DNA or RNA helicase
VSDISVTFYRGNRCKLDSTHPYFDIIREHFSYNNTAATFSGNDNIPKRIYSISKVGYCDIGLIWDIIKFIKRQKWGFKLNISEGVKNRLINPITCDIVNVPNSKYELRDYQLEGIQNAFKLGNGIEQVGTGGGKTLIMGTMLESMYKGGHKYKYLIVVPNIGLVNQTYRDFQDFKCSFTYSKWTGNNELDPNSDVVIVNTGFLQRDTLIYKKNERGVMLKDKKGKNIIEKRIPKSDTYAEFLDTVDVLIYDEVHQFFSDKITKASKVIQKFSYVHKFGFTGSLPREGNYERDKIVGYYGPPVYTKTSKELRDEKYLTNVQVKMLEFIHKDAYRIYKFCKNTHATEDYELEIEHVLKSEFRNTKIKNLVNQLHGNCLVLVERIEQGERLREVLSQCEGKRVFFISGETPVPERLAIIDDMERSDDIICIAMSRIFAVGVSINNLPYLVFSYLGKSWAKVIQAIGRGLRLHERKELLYIFDLHDNLIYSSDHANERKEIYNTQEVEFTEFKIHE